MKIPIERGFWAKMDTYLSFNRLTLKSMAQKLNINYSSLATRKRRNQLPSVSDLQKLSEEMKVPVEFFLADKWNPWLIKEDWDNIEGYADCEINPEEHDFYNLQKHQDKTQEITGSPPFSLKDDGILTIPFISQKLSAGVGIDHLSDADMDVEELDILSEMARGLDKKSLVAARVQGDSMIDEHISSGDIAVFSMGLIQGEGIYVINYLGEVLIKRISFDPKTQTVSIISANRNYPVRTANAEDVIVLGKVVGIFHKMDI